jgi:hypothetical protein
VYQQALLELSRFVFKPGRSHHRDLMSKGRGRERASDRTTTTTSIETSGTPAGGEVA